MADLTTFSRRMAKRAEKFPGGVNKLMQRIAIAVDQAVVLATPVDTGRARSNWMASVGEPSSETGPAVSANDAIGSAKAIIETSESGKEIHLTNNLPYISPLNDGSSAQAPKNFVEEAVAVGLKQANKFKVLD